MKARRGCPHYPSVLPPATEGGLPNSTNPTFGVNYPGLHPLAP
jgi:hypothetical protein